MNEMSQALLPMEDRRSLTGSQADRQAILAGALLGVGAEDREAFREVYRLTCDKLFGICLRISRDRTAAEDILADAYLKIWKRAGAWDPARGSAMTWLAAIARNCAIDWHRARVTRGHEIVCDAYHIVDETPDAEISLLAMESDHQVYRCLASLAPAQQKAIRSAFFDGLTYAELASRSGVPLSTVKSRVRRGSRRCAVTSNARRSASCRRIRKSFLAAHAAPLSVATESSSATCPTAPERNPAQCRNEGETR